MNFWSRLDKIVLRELKIWVKRPIYLLGTVMVMLFCTIFYLSFLKDGVPDKVPIGIVDYDNSSISRNFAQQLDATQLGEVVRFANFEEARTEMQAGRITSVCVLPEGLGRDISSQRQPTISFYINGLYFLGGSLAWKDLLTMVNLTAGAVQREVLQMKGVADSEIMGQLRPIDIDVHQIGNATMNYGAYLANMMLPGVLQMMIILVLIYSFGTELKYGTSRHLLEVSGRSIFTAILGKFSLYTILFTTLGWTQVLILYKWMHFPMAGSIWNMFFVMFLFVCACEALAIFIIELVPVCRLAISVGSLVSVLALSLTGFSLPIEAMPAGIRGVAYIFPLRYYYLIYVQEGIFASGIAGWGKYALVLACFLILPCLGAMRLKHAYVYLDYERN